MKKTIILLIILFIFTPLISQDSLQSEELVENTFSPLPGGFREILLGSNLEEAKKLIERDGYFYYRGDPDVSMLLTENRSIIECDGKYYIDRGYFQFYNEKLYTITLVLDQEKTDFHTIFTQFTKKYGKYSELSPKKVQWENESVKLIIEKPLTIKYLDMSVINDMIEEDTTEEARSEELLKEFLGEL